MDRSQPPDMHLKKSMDEHLEKVAGRLYNVLDVCEYAKR